MSNGFCGGSRYDVLVAKEGPAANGVFSVASVVGLLKRSRKSFEGGHAWVSESRGGHEERAGSSFGGFNCCMQGGGSVAKNDDVPCFHIQTPLCSAKQRTAIRCALLA